MSTALQLRRRSQLLGTSVFVEGTVERLGFVSQVWVDVRSLRVAGWSIRCDLALGSSESTSSGSTSNVAVALAASKLLGSGALLLESNALSTPLSTDAYARLIPQVLKTKTGVSLGRLKDFTFDMASGAIASVRTSGTGIPLLPSAVDSTFEIARTDLICDDSLTAVGGAEERLTLLKRGLLEQVGIGKFNWALPLSAGEAPTPDEETLEAIAEAAAIPLAVETTSTESTETTSVAAETVVESSESSSETVNPEDDATGVSETASNDDPAIEEKPLDRAIDVLTSTVQPLLQKLPASLRQRLGLADADPSSAHIAEEDSQSSISPTTEDSEESIGTDESDTEESVETAVEPEAADAVDVSEQDTAESAVDSPSTSSDRSEEIEEESEASPSSESADEDAAAMASETSPSEPLEEEASSDEAPDEQPEASAQVVQDVEDEVSQDIDLGGEDSGAEEDEQPLAIVEIPSMSGSDEELEQAEVIHEEAEPSPEAASSSSEHEVIEPSTGDDGEDTQTVVGATTTAAAVAAVTGIVSTEIGSTEIAPLDPSPEAPAETAVQPSDDIVPPALQTSLPRVPRSTTQSISDPQTKMGTPLQSFVSLPKPKGRVPKSGGSFEPKVKGS